MWFAGLKEDNPSWEILDIGSGLTKFYSFLISIIKNCTVLHLTFEMQAFHPEHKIFVNGLNYFVHLPPRSHGMMSDTLSLKNLSAICYK